MPRRCNVLLIQCRSFQVNIYVMTQPPSGEYVLFDTILTGSGGKLSCSIPEDKKLPVGIYPIKLVVK